MKALVTILILCAATVASTSGSQEGFVGYSRLELTSQDIPRVGKIHISAKAEEGPISEFTIKAFGQEFRLSDSDLRQLSPFSLSSMLITHEPGYELLGGYTIRIQFRRTYQDAEKKLRDETAVISVIEKKGLMAVDVREKK